MGSELYRTHSFYLRYSLVVKIANIHEAQYAHGKADFISKLQIALKEANETSYWLLLLAKTNYIVPAEYDRLESLCRELRITLISSINTAKGNIK